MALWLDVKRLRRDRRGHLRRLAAPRRSTDGRARPDARTLLELTRRPACDWSASIAHLVRLEAEALEVERVNFWGLAPDASTIRCEAGYVASSHLCERGAVLLERDLPEYFAAMREDRVLRIEDVARDPRCRGLRDYCAARGISSMLDIPVWVEGRLGGVLCHEHVGPRRSWTKTDEDFAIGGAQVAAAALAARAHTQAETAACRAAFLDAASRALQESLDVREVGGRAMTLVVPRLADAALLWAQNRDGVLELVAATHVDPRKRDLIVDLAHRMAAPGGAGPLADLVVRQKQSVLVPEVRAATLARLGVTEAQVSDIMRLGLSSAMGIPLLVAGKAFGALTYYSATRRYDDSDLQIAHAVGERVACALENARLYTVAREAVRSRDEFLILASHELRTPLTTLMLSSSDALRRAQRSRDGQEEKRCEVVVQQVRRLGLLVERMLEAVQTRAEGIVLVRSTCDLAYVVERAVRRASERARRAGCRLVVERRSPAIGPWDCDRLERAVGELLDNAIKFSAGQPIEVVVDRDGSQAVLMVRDRGPGVAPDRLRSIFAPFERAVPKEHFGGLGLGLYIVREIVRAHGGTVSAANDAAGGASFVVRLPLAQPDA